MAVPLRLVPMSPVYNTAAGFTIGTINSFKPLFGTLNVFVHPGGHPVNKVEVFAIVSEKVVKENYVKITLDDGTGCIQCFGDRTGKLDQYSGDCKCAAHELAQKNIRSAIEHMWRKDECGGKKPKNYDATGPSLGFLENLLENSDPRVEDVNLGDIVILQGILRPSKWEDGVLLRCEKFRNVSEDPRVLDDWLDWFRDAEALHTRLCHGGRFVPEQINAAIEKKMLVQKLTDDLVSGLRSVFSASVLASDSSYCQFYGYEVFEFSAVLKVMDEVFKESETCSRGLKLSSKESREIRFRSLTQVLHCFIVEGRIFKRKGLYHTRMTGVDQLDALYFVTGNCKRLADIVNFGDGLVGCDLDSLRECVAASEYYFLIDSKHFSAVMSSLMQRYSIRS